LTAYLILLRLLDSNIAISYPEGVGSPIRWKNQNVKMQDSNVKTVKSLGGMFEANRRYEKKWLHYCASALKQLQLLSRDQVHLGRSDKK
jgi:hypothetical protein